LLYAQGIVNIPVPTMAFQTEKIVVKEPCFPLEGSIQRFNKANTYMFPKRNLARKVSHRLHALEHLETLLC